MNRRIIFALFVLIGAVVSAQAQPTAPDDLRTWTTVGSAGTVDEADLGKVVLDHATAQIGQVITTTGGGAKTAAAIGQTTSAVIRYNVVPVDGLFAGRVSAPSTRGHQLKVRYLATGPGARVTARLIEVDFASGAETTLLTFDSASFPAATGYHVNSVSNCQPPPFDFVKKGYYVEVTLTRSSLVAGSAAGVQVIKIATDVCLG